MYSFKMACKQAVQAPTKSPDFDAACANMQNIGEFNQLKYRGSDTFTTYQITHENTLNQSPRQSVFLECLLDHSSMSSDPRIISHNKK